MLINLALGTLVISATIVVHTFGLIAVTRFMGYATARFPMHRHRSRVVAMVATVLGLFAVMTTEVWLWALCHYALRVVPDFETALYFSLVTFSTLGYGDAVPAPEWRIFAGLEGANGFLLIGWSTAYLVAAGVRIGPFRAGEHF
ncbi:MAG: potassium channel family protein [Alphaproteobacteria bacterium]|nr:potassium channel family protein [Alphaproteobacteria bacterium]MBU0802639.1 potassium channel family protein [Alphaproteobacteria bacterium]MBU0871436.1 potassium channel family protein [Alphaproteobacteria bacterium]MBU1400103.1 potassium channel family protein [Alphaproteobacteria bacterium]MBU1591223.1 potassium channel family protein [Alphaproteobacteria bacterium]